MPADDGPTPALSSLIFPSASTSISHFHRSLARSRLTISGRLHSIAHDARFVQRAAEHYALPLVANERCGSWYIPPQLKGGSVYFKSTDGHAGQWRFSTRRLNLHLLAVIASHGGCIIVDSTRRGKSMPDALSKTVPIWIAVVNRLLFPDDDSARELLLPDEVISASEHAQIEARIAGFVDEASALGLDLAKLRLGLERPLRPYWTTQSSGLRDLEGVADVHPVVLCTASGRDVQVDGLGFDYVQGAADDAEAWACGLSPLQYWESQELLLSLSEDDLPESISTLSVESKTEHSSASSPRLVKPTNQIFIGSLDCVTEGFDLVVTCRSKIDAAHIMNGPKCLVLPCEPGKLGSRTLRQMLPQVVSSFDDLLGKIPAPTVLITCSSGKDHSIGVALAVMCLYVSDDGTVTPRQDSCTMSKDFIRKRLSWITVELPDVNPSRATLQSVNAYLLGDG